MRTICSIKERTVPWVRADLVYPASLGNKLKVLLGKTTKCKALRTALHTSVTMAEDEFALPVLRRRDTMELVSLLFRSRHPDLYDCPLEKVD